MNVPRIYTEFQVWHSVSNNLVAYFESALDASNELTNWVARNGESALDELYLILCKWSPDLTDEEDLELEDDEWAGPGMKMLELLKILSMAECSGKTAIPRPSSHE